jgi:hypothetical protein
MSGTRTKTLHFPGKNNKKNNNNNKHDDVGLKSLCLPFLTCSLNIYFIYGVGSGGFPVDCMFSNWLE